VRKLWLASSVAVSILQLPQALAAQQAVPTFKSSVAVVPISAVVQDRRGRMITSLTASDFEVVDKGQPRPILDFHAEQDSPLTIAVLIDTSGSMRVSSKFELAHEVLKQLGVVLQDGRDEVSLFTFDASLRVEQPFSPHPALVADALAGAEPFGTTSLYDAIAQTATKVAERQSTRRAILVLTDGIDTSSAMTAPEASALASSIDVPVYVVATVAPIDRAAYQARAASERPAGETDLRDVAVWTGGELYWVTRPEDAMAQARAIVAELRHEYVITVESADNAEWRPLEVRVRNRGLAVRARSGYFGR
jgi:Ca-activated chloride channel homolog